MTTVDARGKSCPLPIVLLAKAMKEVSARTTVMVQADDRAFPRDLEAWCQRTGNEILSLEDLGGTFEAIVRRS